MFKQVTLAEFLM